MADSEAKKACSLDIVPSDIVEVSLSQCVSMISDIIKKRWQSKWEHCSSGRFCKDIVPQVGSHIFLPMCRSSGISMVRALLNNPGVRDNLFRFKLADSPNCPDCKSSRQTVDHVLLHCPRYACQRLLLRLSLPSRLSLSLENLLYPALSKSERKAVMPSIHRYFKNIVF